MAGSEKGVWELGKGDGLFIILISVVVSWACTCVRRYQIDLFKYAQFFVRQVHVIKENKAAIAIDSET